MANILIIEDDDVLRKAYEMILTKEGFVVTTAKNGEEGLQAALTQDPALVLVDMLMPESNGLDFLRKYEPAKNHPNVKIIVFSNISIPSVVHEAINLGASNYTTKASKSPKELVELIKSMLAPGSTAKN